MCSICPEAARFNNLLHLPEGKDIGKEINEAFGLIEQENPELKGASPAVTRRWGAGQGRSVYVSIH